MTDVVAVQSAVSRETAPDAAPDLYELERRLEEHRTELTAYCYRMLGSPFEADDAVQDTLLRAWRGLDRYEGRASLRSWLYRIATNVCFDMLGSRQRRALPVDMGPARHASDELPPPLPETTWIEPVPDDRVLALEDPAEVAVRRDTVRLAFVAALHHLPPRQRAVLILREVLQWQAAEVASLMDTTVASVNSALQRARATLEALPEAATPTEMDADRSALLERYVAAFESYDMDALTALLHEDANWSMPPFAMWLRGHADIRAWCLGTGRECRGSRLVATSANGMPAFGQYRWHGPELGYRPWSLQVLDVAGGRLAGVTFFLDVPHLFPLFGLPATLDA